MFTRLDHVGIVVPTWEQASHLLLEQFGLDIDVERTALPEGNYYAPGNTRIFFVAAGSSDTRIEVLIPQDTASGIARFMARRGPGLHHLCYASDDPQADARRLRDQGLQQILAGQGDVNPEGAPFFHPKSMLGILTEIVHDRMLRPQT
ncbi:MAG: VOC family protein [Dehalococcoidia bacterium]